ncbi:DnaB helicase C-terminal domain-containing protein [Collinsella tanakaei]|uniref:DnaB helicase C-terminal domain-containing protein n=1 Tax=Collinsella tanakaei TaxID=626935 RepID=UPI001F271BAF|nr:DnaB helicase C-terminal domain-containing protein [Collinsella tanakaei]MCF2622291.1 hypothetical protein [Collinsella tanakaei]
MHDFHSLLETELTSYITDMPRYCGFDLKTIGIFSAVGGLKPGSLTVAAADKITGAVAAHTVLCAAKHGQRTLFIPLRGAASAVERLVSIEMGITTHEVVSSTEGRIRALEGVDRIRKLPISLWTTDLVSTTMLWEIIEQERDSSDEDLLVVIDSIELVESSKGDLISVVRALRSFTDQQVTIVSTASYPENRDVLPFFPATSIVRLCSVGDSFGRELAEVSVVKSEYLEEGKPARIAVDPWTFLPVNPESKLS